MGNDLEPGIYIALVDRVRLVHQGVSSYGNWFLFELTLSILSNGKLHGVKYREPSWTLRDIFDIEEMTQEDFMKLQNKFVRVYFESGEKPCLIEMVPGTKKSEEDIYLSKLLERFMDMEKESIEISLAEYPDVLNPKMVAQYLGIGYSKALALIKSGAIPCIRIGNHYKVYKAGLIQWLTQPGYREYL